MIRRLLDRLRWRTLHGDLDYAAAGDQAWLHLSRGRWRRPVEISQDRDELLDLARCIVDLERTPEDEAVNRAVERVLDAARQVASLRTFADARDWRRVADAHLELRAAVDALDGDPDSETDALVVPVDGADVANPADASHRLATDELADWERELLEREAAQRPVHGQASCRRWISGQWLCVRKISERPCASCPDVQAPDAPPEANAAATDDPDPTDGAPEAGYGGSGLREWGRDAIQAVVRSLRAQGPLERSRADEVEALLAERDELAGDHDWLRDQLRRRTRQLHAARAETQELATELANERTLHQHTFRLCAEARGEVDRLRREQGGG